MLLLYACVAALCVALSAFWAKAGTKKGDAAPAAGIAVLMTCIFAFLLAKESIVATKITGIGIKTWVFILLSGIATAGAILCFFQAVQIKGIGTVRLKDGLVKIVGIHGFSRCNGYNPPCGASWPGPHRDSPECSCQHR